MYIIKIEAVKAPHEIEFLTVFSPIEVGTEIGYSRDVEETDEIKKWKVCSCKESNKQGEKEWSASEYASGIQGACKDVKENGLEWTEKNAKRIRPNCDYDKGYKACIEIITRKREGKRP